MIKKSGKPITGAQPKYSRKPPLVPNANQTSAQEQTMIAEAPSPFKNRTQTPQISAPTNPEFRANPQFHKDLLRYGATGRSFSIRNAPDVDMAAVGYESRATKSTSPIISGFPQRGAVRVVGGGNQPKATKSQRAKYPGIFGR
jgi:hypothetical protein